MLWMEVFCYTKHSFGGISIDGIFDVAFCFDGFDRVRLLGMIGFFSQVFSQYRVVRNPEKTILSVLELQNKTQNNYISHVKHHGFPFFELFSMIPKRSPGFDSVLKEILLIAKWREGVKKMPP